ncbi:cytochrome P450 oxidoreductase protein [Rutstroemia sp. NJR-2017a WRK4]|nr:cytochrome P450 oxidoreductase protein [Rutstroemia sp. NJR-2017a WRK4]
MSSFPVDDSFALALPAIFFGSYQHNLLRVAELLLLGLVTWRFWRFTLSPILYPDDPKELPYWIPCHGPAFFHNSQVLLSKASKHFGVPKEPFALTLFGSRMYIISDSKQTNEVYKNLETLSFIEFVQHLFKTNGVTESGLKAAYMDLPSDKAGFPNPQGKSLGGTLVRAMHIHQLYPGENLDHLEARFLEYFQEHLTLPMMRKACASYMLTQDDTSVNVPLMRWCSEYFVRAGGLAYFGDMLGAIDPKLASTFIEFDDLSWQAIYQYPDFFTREMRGKRAQTQLAFKKYFEVPQNQRTGDAWFTKTMENELRAVGVCTSDIAIILVTLHWAINTNTRKTAFWMLTYVLHNPSYIEQIRKETAPAFEGKKLVDLEFLHDKCPLLESCWFETLRMASNAASVRQINKDTIIGGKVLRKGNRIMIPYRLLHFDESVYGDDVYSFKPERFAGAAADKLTRGDSWRPFGGGKTMCSGRHVAKRATLMFLAMVLRNFEVEIVGEKKLPVPDLGRPVLGIMAVKDDDDYTVNISERILA